MPDPVIKTQATLAEVVGKSQQAVSKLLKRADCPVPRTGPWTAEQVNQFVDFSGSLQEDRSAIYRDGANESPAPSGVQLTGDQVRAIEVRLKMERMKKVKIEREILERLYVSREEVELGWAQRARFFRESLETMPGQIAAQCVGLEAEEIEKLLRARVFSIIDNYGRRPYPGVGDAA